MEREKLESTVGGGELALGRQDARVNEGLDALFLRHAANSVHGALHSGLQRIAVGPRRGRLRF